MALDKDNGARGDGIWMFSLNGTIQPVVPGQGPAPFGGAGRAGASLRDGLTVETTDAVTSTGRNNMPSFGEAYSVDELYDVATFIVERLAAE